MHIYMYLQTLVCVNCMLHTAAWYDGNRNTEEPAGASTASSHYLSWAPHCPPIGGCSRKRVTQSNAGITNTVILHHVLEIMFTPGIKISPPHIPRNIKLMRNWYEEMKTHLRVNKTSNQLCIARLREASESQPQKQRKHKRKTDSEDKENI